MGFHFSLQGNKYLEIRSKLCTSDIPAVSMSRLTRCTSSTNYTNELKKVIIHIHYRGQPQCVCGPLMKACANSDLFQGLEGKRHRVDAKKPKSYAGSKLRVWSDD